MPANNAGLLFPPVCDFPGIAAFAFFLAAPLPTFQASQPSIAFRLLKIPLGLFNQAVVAALRLAGM